MTSLPAAAMTCASTKRIPASGISLQRKNPRGTDRGRQAMSVQVFGVIVTAAPKLMLGDVCRIGLRFSKHNVWFAKFTFVLYSFYLRRRSNALYRQFTALMPHSGGIDAPNSSSCRAAFSRSESPRTVWHTQNIRIARLFSAPTTCCTSDQTACPG